MSFFNFEFDDDVRYAKELMSQGKYKDAIDYMDEHTPIGVKYQFAEAFWIIAQCHYCLHDYNMALLTIKTLVNLPMDGLMINKDAIRSYQRQASELKQKIEREMAESNVKVKFPSRPFANFIETIPVASSDRVIETYEGISENLGDYYIKNSIETKGEDLRINVYFKPVAEHEMEVFVYVDFIDVYFQKTDDDAIVSFVLTQKYPTLAKMIKAGKKGPSSECSVYKSHDYNRPPLQNYPPVFGKKVFVSNSRRMKLNDLEDEVSDVAEMYWRLVKEISDNPFTAKDNVEIALLAMAKGAATKVAGVELGPKVKELLRSIFH